MSPSSSDTPDKPQSIYGSRKASLALNVIVVGCGVGGLSAAFCLSQAGHSVTIVESSPVIRADVGAGILSSPNCSRLLSRWGLGTRLDELAASGKGIIVRKHNTGEQIEFRSWGEIMRNYGAPYYQIHRADIHELLCELVASNVTILADSPVVGCDPNSVAPSVTLESGKILKADLIVGADGLKSYIQQVVLGVSNRAEETGDATFRALVPTSLMAQDPELRELIENPHLTEWLAPGRKLVGYSVRKRELYNLVLLHQDEGGSVESWDARGNIEDMKRIFADYEPRVQKILALVQSSTRFRLMDRKPLEKWTHDSGRVTLLGDACHPMLPYRASGAAMAIEDAAVLGNLLSRISHISQLRSLLQAYQDLRLERTAAVQRASRADQMKKPTAPGSIGNRAELQWAQPVANQKPGDNKVHDEKLLSYDADAEVDKWWASHGKGVEALV